MPMSSDEAYYWVWSKNLQLSYYDHPPAVAWLFYLGQYFEPWGQAVRWPAVVIGHLTLLFWALSISLQSSIEKVRWWMWLAIFSPLLGFGSLIVTPDIPVVFFWSVATYALLRYLASPHVRWASLLGAALGLGFCSKYHIVLFALFALIFLLREGHWKKIRSADLAACVIIGCFFSLPVLIWNFQHDFISFRFQLDHGFGAPKWSPLWSISYPIGQALGLFPLVAWAALKAKPTPNQRLFLYIGWGPLLFFFISSFRGVVELNWPIVGYPAVFALAVIGMQNRRPMLYANACWIFLFGVILFNFAKPFFPHTDSKLNEPFYYKPVLAALERYQPVYANSYQMASVLWYHKKTPFYKLREMGRRDFYDTLEGGIPTEYPIYVIMENYSYLPLWMTPDKYKADLIENLDEPFHVYRVIKK